MAESILKLDTCNGHKVVVLGIKFGFIMIIRMSSDSLWIAPHPRVVRNQVLISNQVQHQLC